MITSCSLRFKLRSADRKLVFASCWVSVEPPSRNAAGLDIARQRPGNAARIDAPMRIEAPVLDGDQRLGDILRQPGNVDRRFLVIAAPRDRPAAAVGQHQRRLPRRLERATERGGEHKPDQQSDDEAEKDGGGGDQMRPDSLEERASGGWGLGPQTPIVRGGRVALHHKSNGVWRPRPQPPEALETFMPARASR